MELLRLGAAGNERPAVRHHGTIYDLSPVAGDIDAQFLGSRGIERTRAALRTGSLRPMPGAESLRVGPPVARPAALLCIGLNYAAHAAESGGTPPAEPVLFFKHPNTIVGPNDDVVLPANSERTDWEVELAAIVGATARLLDDSTDPLDYVAGYTVANDLSERTAQLHSPAGQWSKGKSFPTFCPLGPALVPADEVAPQALTIRSWVNGESRQDSSTQDMIFSVAELVRDLSRYLVLEPGDVICTGTPAGVALSGRFAYLQAGDIVELEVEQLGLQRQRVVDSVLAR